MPCEPPDQLVDTSARPRTVLTRTVMMNGIETVSIIGSRHVPQPVDDRARKALAE